MTFRVNPHEDDPDFQYLATTNKMMLDEAAKPYDGKTSCWIPDKKEGFLKCTITSTKGDEVSVTTEKLEVGNFLIFFYIFVGVHSNAQ